MKKTLIGILVVVVIVVIVLVSSKSGGKGPLKIGVITVLSGERAALGQNYLKGIQYAASSSVDQKVSLFVEDDAFDKTKTLAAYHKLVDTDHVDAIIVADSQALDAIYPEVSKTKIPVVSYGGQSIPETKDNIFQIFTTQVPIELVLGNLVRSVAPSTGTTTSATSTVVGVYTNDPVLVGFYNAFQSGYGADIPDFNINPGTADYKKIAKDVFAKKPKYIFMTNAPEFGANFIKEYRDLVTKARASKPTFVFDMTLNNETVSQYKKILGDTKFIDGSMVVSIKPVDEKDFIAKYKAQNSVEPPQLADYGYDALNLLINTHDSTKWIENLESAKFSGVTGDISFDNFGRRAPVFSVSTLTDGKVPEYK